MENFLKFILTLFDFLNRATYFYMITKIKIFQLFTQVLFKY